MTKKYKRLIFTLLSFSVLAVATFFILTGLRNNLVFFYSPSELNDPLIAQKIENRPFRLGGMVADGSIETLSDGVTTSFIVTDRQDDLRVFFKGVLPDLFREGQGVVAIGKLDASSNSFIASKILAKHDENYMPPSLKDKLDAVHQTGAEHSK